MSKLWAGGGQGRASEDNPCPPGKPGRAVRRAGPVLAGGLAHCANVASDFISQASAYSSVEWEHAPDPLPGAVGGVMGQGMGRA